MACVQESSTYFHASTFVRVVWIVRVLARLERLLPGRQTQPRLADDLQRLAETSPHLLEDIGVAFDAQLSVDTRPEWTRGI